MNHPQHDNLTQLELERLPRRPVLDRKLFGERKMVPGPATLPHRWPMPSGRVALTAALQNAGLKAGDEVLVPAYHCTAMIEPIVWLQMKPVFLPIHQNLSLDMDAASPLLESASALIVIHYFGFPQKNMTAIRTLCDTHNLILIEDCAHCYYGMLEHEPCGHVGDYAITSAKKFFPIYDGGELFSKRPLPANQLRPVGLLSEFKALVNILDRSRRYGRWPWLHRLLAPLRVVQQLLWNTLKALRGSSTPTAAQASSSDGGQQFNATESGLSMSRVSQWIIKRSDHGKAVKLRRQRYQTLLDQFSGVAGCRPLFPELPAHAAPYLFPLYVDRVDDIFQALKADGVPIERFGEQLWPGVDAHLCAVSSSLSKHVLQFPCHQGIRDTEADWMANRIMQEIQAP